MKGIGFAPFVLLAWFGAGPAATLGCQSRAPAGTPSVPGASPATPAAARTLPDDGMVDVGGGVSLHVHCVGQGSPMVLLDECLGCQVSSSYRPIWSDIGRFTRACGYDRAGSGYSGPAPKPHLARQLVGDLHNLLGDRDDSGAVVLIGHGLGGLVAQLYARDFPRAVAGMVLVDPQTKDYDTRYYALYPPNALAGMRADMAAKPENVDPDDLAGAMADLRGAPLSLGDRPLVVVTRGKPQEPRLGVPADAWDKLEATWRAMEDDVMSLSRNSAHTVAPDAASILDEAPDRVVAAAWQVVSSVRSGIPLSRLPATAPPAAPSSMSPAPVPPPAPQPIADDGVVDIGGGTSLHVHCAGHGSPTVVIDNGHAVDGTSWSPVLGDFARITRTCVYDRRGIGFSPGPAPTQHSFRQMAHELQALLERAAIPGPYVLVAHSMGGINVRLFQAEHPDEVVGMVLVDVETEASAAPSNPDQIRALMRDDPEGIDYDTMVAGLADFRASVRPLGDMPLWVLSAGGKEPLPPGLTPELKAALLEEAALQQKAIAGQEQVAHLSTNSAHATADHSGHFIQIDAPRLVVAAVRQVVDAVRTHGRLDAKALEPFLHEGPYLPGN